MKLAIRLWVVALLVGCGFVAGCDKRDGMVASLPGVGAGLRVAAAPTTTSTPIRLAGDVFSLDEPVVREAAGAQQPRASRAVARPIASSRPAPIGRIEIASIGVNEDFFNGVDDHTLRFGPGHWEITAMPGQVGNATFGGHRTTFTQPFHDIDKIAVGDEVVFTTAAGRFVYRATQHFIVDDEDVWIAEPTDTPTFTLFACHPKGSSRQRYVVKGELVGAPAAAPAPAYEPSTHAPREQPRGCLLCTGK